MIDELIEKRRSISNLKLHKFEACDFEMKNTKISLHFYENYIFDCVIR